MLLLLVVASLLAVGELRAETEELCSAESTWAEVLVAKGGKKLEMVESMYVLQEYRWKKHWRSHLMEDRTLYVFPHFIWSWFDHGIEQLGVRVERTRLDKDETLLVMNSSMSPARMRVNSTRLKEALALLLETRWSKGQATACTEEPGLTKLSVRYLIPKVTATLYLKSGARLPHRVDLQDELGTRVCTLEDYQEVQGLFLPGRVRSQYGPIPSPMMRVQYILNPDYDRSLPDRAPSIQSGPNAWRNPSTR